MATQILELTTTPQDVVSELSLEIGTIYSFQALGKSNKGVAPTIRLVEQPTDDAAPDLTTRGKEYANGQIGALQPQPDHAIYAYSLWGTTTLIINLAPV